MWMDTRSCPLHRTASLSLEPFKAILAPRGHSEIILDVDPESAVTRVTHLGVSPHLPSDKEINLLRDYRPTLGSAVTIVIIGAF